jgi:hypothetical protein
MPWPRYDAIVVRFFEAALVRRASLDQVKTMLTCCVRGERFGEGHWGAMIEGGQVQRLLERLAEIRAQA